MLTFLIGLSLGTCIGAVVAGVCRASYERDATERERAAPAEHPTPVR